MVEKQDPGAIHLRDFICKYKNMLQACRYCPTHPALSCKWNSSNPYYYLVCEGDAENGVLRHQMNIFSILTNFNLEAAVLGDKIWEDLLYIHLKYC